MEIEQSKPIKVSELNFDRDNPRLPEFGLTPKSTDEEIIQILWEAMDVRELVLSMAASGFFKHEPLLVEQANGKKTVIEGNRRLAALKIILDKSIRELVGYTLPPISQDILNSLDKVPVVISDRKEAWRYLGFKHVNGPAKWGSYAKSKYIADVHRNYEIPLEDIARQIGDTHNTVQRLYRGLMVIEQAERTGVFKREDRVKPRFAFSHMYIGLGYSGISAFLSLKSETDESDSPVPDEKLNDLGELCKWLYGSKKDAIQPVVESQNPDLRRIDAVLKNRESLAALRDNVSLVEAYEISRPSSTVFEESLLASKRYLQKARAMLSDGYDGSDELLRIAGSVANMADDLYQEMENKRKPQKKTRLVEES